MKRILMILILAVTLAFICGCESRNERVLNKSIESCKKQFIEQYQDEIVFVDVISFYKKESKKGNSIFVIIIYGEENSEMYLIDSSSNVWSYYTYLEAEGYD